MVVARGIQSSALKWKATHEFLHKILLDPDLQLYRALGLQRTVKGVWSPGTMIAYAEEDLAGLPPAPAYDGDDIHILGGDYITDSCGKLVYCYGSQFSSDRPSVEQLLSALDSELL